MYEYSLNTTGYKIRSIEFNLMPDKQFYEDLLQALHLIQADFAEPGEGDPTDISLLTTTVGFFQLFTRVKDCLLNAVDEESDLTRVGEALSQSEKFKLIAKERKPPEPDKNIYTGSDDYDEYMDDGIFGFR